MNVLVSILSAHILSMLGFSSYAVSLLALKDLWALSNTESGLVASAFFLGYMACVSMWTAMTDRRDAQIVYVWGCLLSSAGSLGFALFADDFYSALVFQLVLGAGVSATYMPGLRILSELTDPGPRQSRWVSFYTAFFGVGVAASLMMSGLVSETLGWRYSFGLAAVGPFGALILMHWVRVRALRGGDAAACAAGIARFQGLPLGQAPSYRALLHQIFPISGWRRALQDKPVKGYTLGYAVHCLELLGTRSWTVAFLSFSISLQAGAVPLTAATMAALINLISTPASILGNELALKIGRRAWIVIVMASGSVMGVVMSFCVGAPWWLLLTLVALHSMLIMADSATLTAGLIASVPPEVKGAAMGLYSLLGFGAGAVGPALFGAALDIAGGASQPLAWAAAFLSIGLGCLAYPFIDRQIFQSSPFRN